MRRRVFPRSAVKALQCLAAFESGAVDKFAFSDAQIALFCSSHSGEPQHVDTARAVLAAIGLTEAAYECGAHFPIHEATHHAMLARHDAKLPIHNNCSGKHAGAFRAGENRPAVVACEQKIKHRHAGGVRCDGNRSVVVHQAEPPSAACGRAVRVASVARASRCVTARRETEF